MTEHQQYFDLNKEHWDIKAKYHVESKFYDVPAFKAGKTTLTEIELSELPDVNGKSLLHLQCHFGMDSISLERMGAKVTAIDFSTNAIEEANKLNEELGSTVKFIESNVLNIDEVLNEKYDIIYTSYGVICWLPELETWAKQIKKHLKDGGIFYLVEFHPTLWMFDHPTGKIGYRYFNDGSPYIETVKGTYADFEADLQSTECFWSHSFMDICNALINQGLKIDFLHEFDFSPFNCFENMEMRKDKQFVYKNNDVLVPATFSIQCSNGE